MNTKINKTEWANALKTIDAFTNRIYAACEAVEALGDFDVYVASTRLEFDYDNDDIDQEARITFNFILNWVGRRQPENAPHHDATLMIMCDADRIPSIEYLTGYIQCLLEGEELRIALDE